MKLAWHIVKKDFRRLWGPLALWTLLLIAKGEVGVSALASEGGEERVFYFSLCENTLVVLEVIVNLLLVAALVQEDVVVGTGMFWATRPISGGRLLAAKLLGAALMFGVLPVVVAVRWWMVCGYGPPEMARAALAIADAQLVTVGVALLLAVMTKNINEFLGWAMGLAVGGVLWFLWLAPRWSWLRSEVSWGVSETREVLVFVLMGIGAATVIAHQFLTRRLARTRLIVAMVALVVAAVSQGRWDFSRLWLRAPYSAVLAEGVSVEAERLNFEKSPAVEFVFRGVPERYGMRLKAAQTWRWPDETTAAAQSDSLTGPWPGWAEWQALGLPGGHTGAAAIYEAAGPQGATGGDRTMVRLPLFIGPEKVSRLQAEPAAYTAEMHVALERPGLEFELPARTTWERRLAGFYVRMGESKWVDGEWRATVLESRPSFARYGRWRPHLAALFGLRGITALSFALVNREKGEAIKVWRRGGGGRLHVGGQELTWDVLRGPVPREAEAENPEASPRWLDGATIAVMRYREEARFDREIKVERFPTLNTATPSKDKSP